MKDGSGRTAEFIVTTYDQLAQLGESDLCCSPVGLYTAEELAALPDEVRKLSSGCGHPVADAGIQPGDVVVDIGSGAGADCQLAARRTGPQGRVIGIDPSPTMRQLASQHRDDLGLSWIEFREGTADRLPLDDDSADVVVSNCVLSLSTDPDGTWTEIARVLKRGGRAVVSDIVGGTAQNQLLGKTRCETGIGWRQYHEILRKNGFTGTTIRRVSTARFRDNNTATSISFHAWHGMPIAHATLAVLHDRAHRADADAFVAELTHSLSVEHYPVSVDRLDVEDPVNAEIGSYSAVA